MVGGDVYYKEVPKGSKRITSSMMKDNQREVVQRCDCEDHIPRKELPWRKC